jgi:hypothetical protein
MCVGMSSHRLTRRVVQVAVTLLVLLAGTGLAAAAWQAPRAVVAAAGAIELRDDDGNTPMFDLGPLRPGEGGQHCIEVTVVSGTPARVGIAATGVTSGLDAYLDLDIESGTGGGFGSCGGFSGTSIYHGTLADFLATFPAGSPLEDWTPTADGQRRTYRIGVRLRDDEAAQGGKAAVNLVWRGRTLLDTEVVTPPPTTTPSRTPTTTDGGTSKSDDTSTSTPSSDTSTPEGDGTTSEPTDAATPDGTATTADEPADRSATSSARRHENTVRVPATGAARREAPPVKSTGRPAGAKAASGVVHKVTRALGDAAQEVAKAAAPAAKRAAFPLVLVALLLLFLALQNRLDSRDPKLAHAPVHGTPDLAFEPHPPGAPLS